MTKTMNAVRWVVVVAAGLGAIANLVLAVVANSVPALIGALAGGFACWVMWRTR